MPGSRRTGQDRRRAGAQAWTWAREMLDGLPGGEGLNIAYEAVDRHARDGRGDKTAVRLVGRCAVQDISYRDLTQLSNRFANGLRQLDILPGDRMCLLAGKRRAFHIGLIGALKRKVVACPLASGLGPDPLRSRLVRARAKVLVTTGDFYEQKVVPILRDLPDLRWVIVDGPGRSSGRAVGVVRLEELLASGAHEFQIDPTDPEDLALLHFTSGTTGEPKGALHVHGAVVGHLGSAVTALELRPDDVFWCSADSGWVTGTSYGVIAPLTRGSTNVVDEAGFDARYWYQLIESQRVSVWYTTPTAIRLLMRAGDALAGGYDLHSLRVVASIGEPLSEEATRWGEKVLGCPVRDTWWQTETGSIMIANYPATAIRPGSIGRALPGVDAAVVARREHGRAALRSRITPLRTPGAIGELAIRAGWPSMFRSYLSEAEEYARSFAEGWYMTGDLVRRDSDGYFWFVGRADDVINSAGHLIGPFEVESVLMQHPAVAEAAAIGVPDPIAGEAVKAFVTLNGASKPDDHLRLELIGWAREHLGTAMAPRQIAFEQHLPHTESGKVIHREIKAKELRRYASGDIG